jgi:hypothetical protein
VIRFLGLTPQATMGRPFGALEERFFLIMEPLPQDGTIRK